MLPCHDPEYVPPRAVYIERRGSLFGRVPCDANVVWFAVIRDHATGQELARTRAAGSAWQARGRALARRRGWFVLPDAPATSKQVA